MSFFEKTNSHGEENIRNIEALQKLAIENFNQRKYEKALSACARICDLYEERKGTNPRDTARSIHNLAVLYAKLGEREEAKSLYSKALKIKKNLLDSNSHSQELTDELKASIANTQLKLAKLYIEQGEYTKADKLLKSARKARKQVFGVKSLPVAEIHFTIGTLKEKQKDLQGAMECYEKAYDIRGEESGYEFNDGESEAYENWDRLRELKKAQPEKFTKIPSKDQHDRSL